MEIIDIHVHPGLLGRTIDDIIGEAIKANVKKCNLLGIDLDLNAFNNKKIRDDFDSRYRDSIANMIYSPWIQRIVYTFGYVGHEAYMKFLQYLQSAGSKAYSNSEIADEIKNHPDIFTGFGSIALTKEEEYVRSKLREIKELGLKGIKLLPTIQLFDPANNENFMLTCQYAEKENLILLMHTGCDPGPFEIPEMSEYANPLRLRKVLEIYKPKMILAHMGAYSAFKPGIWLDEALEIGKKYDNVWFDTSAVNWYIFTREKIIETIRSNIGFERIIFGSDYPALEGATIGTEVNAVLNCEYLSEDEKEKILGLNAKEILEL